MANELGSQNLECISGNVVGFFRKGELNRKFPKLKLFLFHHLIFFFFILLSGKTDRGVLIFVLLLWGVIFKTTLLSQLASSTTKYSYFQECPTEMHCFKVMLPMFQK